MSKNVVILLAETVNFHATDEATQKLMKKALILDNYKGGNLAEFLEIGCCKEIALETLSTAWLESERVALIKVKDANTVLAQIDEATNRNSLTVIITPNQAAFEGVGINSKLNTLSREVYAKDIIVTICYLIDVSLSLNPMGSIIYQALKEPNLKMVELEKAQVSIDGLEHALARATGKAKHDCA